MTFRKLEHLLSRGRLQSGRESCFRRISIDSRTIRKGELFWAIKGGCFDGNRFVEDAFKKGAAGAVISLDVPPKKLPCGSIIRVKNGECALQQAAACLREQTSMKVIGIVGSNGKTTTKKMIAHLLAPYLKVGKTEGNFNNHIGLPFSLMNVRRNTECFIAEMGMNRFGDIDLLARISRPDCALFTNIGPAHVGGVRSLKGVLKAKSEILDHLPDGACVIVNNDDPCLRGIINRDFNFVTYGIHRTSDFKASGIKTAKGLLSFTLNGSQRVTVPCLGKYNVYNVLAAIACAKSICPRFKIKSRMFHGFNLPGMRMQAVQKRSVTFLNDAYNANPASVREALRVFKDRDFNGRRKVFIFGDMLELGRRAKQYHRDLGHVIAASRVKVFVAIGKYSREAADIVSLRTGKDVFEFSDVDRFIGQMNNIIQKEDVVLLKGSRAMRLEKILENKEYTTDDRRRTKDDRR